MRKSHFIAHMVSRVTSALPVSRLLTVLPHGLQIQDVPNQLAALQIASGSGHVEPQDLIEAINELVGLNLTPTEQPVVPAEQPLIEEVPAGGGAEVPIEPPTMLKLSKTSEGVLALATDTALALRKRDFATLQKNLAG
jgi:hypothetical protein